MPPNNAHREQTTLQGYVGLTGGGRNEATSVALPDSQQEEFRVEGNCRTRIVANWAQIPRLSMPMWSVSLLKWRYTRNRGEVVNQTSKGDDFPCPICGAINSLFPLAGEDDVYECQECRRLMGGGF